MGCLSILLPSRGGYQTLFWDGVPVQEQNKIVGVKHRLELLVSYIHAYCDPEFLGALTLDLHDGYILHCNFPKPTKCYQNLGGNLSTCS